MKALTQILEENGTFDGLDRRHEEIDENKQKYEVMNVHTRKAYCVNTYQHMQLLIKENRIKNHEIVQFAVVNYNGS